MFGTRKVKTAGPPIMEQPDFSKFMAPEIKAPKGPNFGNIAMGALNGYLASMGNPMGQMYFANQQRKKVMEQREDQYQRQRKDEMADWMARKQWEIENAPPAEPKDQLTRYMINAGIDPNSEYGQNLYRQAAENSANPIQGVRTVNPDGSQSLEFVRPQLPPRKGEIQDGYEFLGGDPANPNSWRPAGGSGSNVGGNFR